MRLLHLSDLHFGTESEGIVNRLMDAVSALAPDLIVISGDFAQVANSFEFGMARDFIAGLPAPVFCVPGNHDIPRYNLAERFFNPYKKYKEFITPDLSPVFINDRLVMVGLNTARPVLPHWNWANGAISRRQLDDLERHCAPVKDRYRICVMHHPIHKAEKAPLKVTVFGARAAMERMHKLGIDLVLTGHVHFASVTAMERTVFASASTAISRRLRSQENGFNVIDLHPDFFEIFHFTFNGERFVQSFTSGPLIPAFAKGRL